MNTQGTTAEFFSRTAQAWEAMYRECGQARESIWFEQYIMMNEGIGERFLKLFLEKAKTGVSVRLVLDGVGCRMLPSSDIIDEIRKAGGLVHFYNALTWRHFFFAARWLPRSHVKTLLIDGKIAYTGSACLWELMRTWHDLQVRLTGDIVEQIRSEMDHSWSCFIAHDKHSCHISLPKEGPLRYIVSEPRFRPAGIYRELLDRIHNAKRRVIIVSPYFVPTRRLQHALQAAISRGVQVDILISAKTDVPLADHVSHSYFSKFLRHGWRIFLYDQDVLHAKYAVIDDDWATVGSSNMDHLSLTLNREANLIIYDPGIIHMLSQQAEKYLLESVAVDDAWCRAVPFPHQALGYLGRCVKGVL